MLVSSDIKFIRPDQKLVGCFAFNGPLRQYFSLYRADETRNSVGMARLAEPVRHVSGRVW